MTIGWLAAAASALLPYFLMERGRGTGGAELLGLSRTAWMSLHVWFSFGMAAITLAHVLLNRAGVARAFRVVSGCSLDPSRTKAAARRPVARRGVWTWSAVLAIVTGLAVGRLALAPASQGTQSSGEQPGRRGRQTADHIAPLPGSSPASSLPG